MDDITIDRIADLNHFLEITRNNLDLIVLIRTALAQIDTILRQMRALSVSAASESLSSDERASLQKQIDYHITEIDHIAAFTDYKAKEIISHDQDQGSNELH